MTISTNVMVTGPANFDAVGRLLGYPLTDVAESISAGLVDRLHRYARQRLDEAGFNTMVEGWLAEVYTMDGGDKPADRSYCVKFKNAKGGYIEVVGILTKHGWPHLDFGYEIGHE